MIDPRFKDLLLLSLTERMQLVEDLQASIAADAGGTRGQPQTELDLGLSGSSEQLQFFTGHAGRGAGN